MNTNHRTKIKISDFFGVSVASQYEKYLGLSSFVGRAKKKSFNYIREWVWHKIQGWIEKLLSQAGHEVLIKFVLQAMPTFTMGCFKLPKSLCKDIESLIRKLWWGYKGEARKIHWIVWDKLCLPKCQGGLRFRDINLALLGKQVWQHVHNMESFYSIKSSKAKFFPNCSVLDSEVKLTGSYAWQSILKARTVVQRGSAWCIDNGR